MKLMGEDIVPLWLFKNCLIAKKLPVTLRVIVKKARDEVLDECKISQRPTKRFRE
jgi:hypothetical protein